VDSKGSMVIIYDGNCMLCNSALRFVRKQDSYKKFIYLPLKLNLAEEILKKNSKLDNLPDSIILVDNNVYYFKSEAIFRIVRHLKNWTGVFLIFKIFPRKLLDKIYDWIASNRYKWFGVKGTCEIQFKEVKS